MPQPQASMTCWRPTARTPSSLNSCGGGVEDALPGAGRGVTSHRSNLPPGRISDRSVLDPCSWGDGLRVPEAIGSESRRSRRWVPDPEPTPQARRGGTHCLATDLTQRDRCVAARVRCRRRDRVRVHRAAAPRPRRDDLPARVLRRHRQLHGRRPPLPHGRARGAHRLTRAGHARDRPLPAARPPRPAAPHPRRSRGLGQRPLRRPRPAEERLHLGRRRAAHVPGHRHRHRQGQEGPVRVHRRRRRGGHRPRRLRHLRARQPALLQMAPLTMWDEVNTGTNLPAEIKIAAVDGDAYKLLFMAKGGGSANKSYLFQETKALLNPAEPAPVPRREAARARHRRLPAVPPGRRHRRHVGRVRGRDGQAGLDPLPRLAAHRGQRRWATASATSSSRPRSSPRSSSSASAPSSAASTSATTCGSSACPATAPRARSAIAVSCSADRQALAKITHDGVFLEQLEHDPARFLPEVDETALGERRGAHRPLPPDGRDPGRAEPLPGQDPPVAVGPDGRGPRHRPRQDQGAPRRRRGHAAVPARPLRLLRRPGQDARGHGLGLVRARPPRAAWTPTSTSSRPPAAAWSCWPRATAAGG